MEPAGFLADVERAPATLRELAGSLEHGDVPIAAAPIALRHVLFVGMGSSMYAAGVVAAMLRAAGVHAVAELASSDLLPPPDPQLLVVAVSASGASAETVLAAARYRGISTLVAVTEDPASAVTEGADLILPLFAGVEGGGVACRSYRHTVAVLLALAEHLAPGLAPDLPAVIRRAAASTSGLLDGRDTWLPAIAEALDGPDGTWIVAAVSRLASAQQSALMLREGPRRPAQAGETGDWSHVDVYLTRTLDYRMLLMPGSRWDGELLRWTSERRSTVVTIGARVPGARYTVGYDGSDHPGVALLTDTTVAELVAHQWWTRPR
jgi:fructoselysine-6-P-deglycase FrlB-like protein